MLAVRLEPTLEKEVERIATLEKQTKSKVVKDALKAYIDEYSKKKKSPFELGAEFFGRYGSKEGDLSTTYKQRLKKKIYAKNSHR